MMATDAVADDCNGKCTFISMHVCVHAMCVALCSPPPTGICGIRVCSFLRRNFAISKGENCTQS